MLGTETILWLVGAFISCLVQIFIFFIIVKKILTKLNTKFNLLIIHILIILFFILINPNSYLFYLLGGMLSYLLNRRMNKANTVK